MSEEKGKLTTCNRCGKTHFSPWIGKGETDGGYTTWDEYEELPDGWMFFTQIGNLCPDCGGLFKAFIHKFMPDKDIAPAWMMSPKDSKWLHEITIGTKEKENGL